MPRYYFNFRAGDDVERNRDGQELPDKEAAKNEARFYASELLRDAGIEGENHIQTVEVTDDRGEVILRFGCADVEEVRK